MSEVLNRDFEYICNSNLDWNAYKGKTILVTGATGLIGSLFIKSLLYVSAKKDLGIKLIAMIRNLEKAKQIFDESSDLKFCVYDFMDEGTISIEDKIDYILHTAAVTTSKEMVARPVDNIKISLSGTFKMLDLAKEKNVSSMLYLSSMEAYGQLNVSDHLITEDELGNVDLSSVRSCYPEGKRMCECLCNSYASQYDLNVIIARLAQTFGPGISKNENRVFAQFAKSAIKGNDIILKTDGMSEGNYVYTADAITAILTLLLKGGKAQTYNVVNENNHMSIKDSANMVATKIAQGKIKVVFDIPEDALSTGYAAPTKMHLSASKINSLGWKAEVSLEDMYRRTIEYLCET